jgi:hypothetical protein
MLAMSHATGTKTGCLDIERRGMIENITLSQSQWGTTYLFRNPDDPPKICRLMGL